MNTTSFATLGIFHNVRSANIYGGSANTDLNQILQWEKNSQFESVIAGYGQNIAPADEDLWIDSDTQLWAPAHFCFRPKFTWDLREFYFWDLDDHCKQDPDNTRAERKIPEILISTSDIILDIRVRIVRMQLTVYGGMG